MGGGWVMHVDVVLGFDVLTVGASPKKLIDMVNAWVDGLVALGYVVFGVAIIGFVVGCGWGLGVFGCVCGDLGLGICQHYGHNLMCECVAADWSQGAWSVRLMCEGEFLWKPC